MTQPAVVEDSETDSMIEDPEINLVISREQIEDLKRNNHAIKSLKSVIARQIENSNWNKFLGQFKRFRNNLRIVDGILSFCDENRTVPVISFNFLVEVTYQIHLQLAYIGRNKIVYMIKGPLTIFFNAAQGA